MFPFTKPQGEAPSDLETIRAKLAACNAEIESAETDLRRVSVTAVLGEDPAAGFDAVTRLNELRTRKELLEAALAQALRQEADARAALDAKVWQAKKRSLSQHIGRFQRDATDVTVALVALRDAFRRLADTGQAIVTLLPPSMRNPARPFHELLGSDYLRDLADVEAFRLSQGGIPAPGAVEHPVRLREFEENTTGAIKPLAEILVEIVGRVRSEFDLASPAMQPSPPPLVTASSAPIPVDVSLSAPAGIEQREGEVIDLRSVKERTEAAEATP